MGLDVTFYKNLQIIEDYPAERIDDDDDALNVWAYDDFKHHYAPLQEGWYTAEETAKFRAGSYGGYNDWRDDLCKLANGMSAKKLWKLVKTDPEKAKKLPFYYLIDFADNEGVIAGEAFKKLASDFEVHEATCVKDGVSSGKDHCLVFKDEWEREVFDEWKNAMAVSDAVDFH